jgi:hypothetical protein
MPLPKAVEDVQKDSEKWAWLQGKHPPDAVLPELYYGNCGKK